LIVADTSGLLAYFDRTEPLHDRVASIVETEREALVVSPYVVAELDYLVSSRFGVDAELAVLEELSGGAYDLVPCGADIVREAGAVIERYRDQNIGVTDVSLVVLAKERSTRTILTLDHRHFDVLRPLTGGRFKLLP
jgi:predicted nucleic acid-binding protein